MSGIIENLKDRGIFLDEPIPSEYSLAFEVEGYNVLFSHPDRYQNHHLTKKLKERLHSFVSHSTSNNYLIISCEAAVIQYLIQNDFGPHHFIGILYCTIMTEKELRTDFHFGENGKFVLRFFKPTAKESIFLTEIEKLLTYIHSLRKNELPYLKAIFSYPEHICNLCLQYLAYFGQCLYDVGIEVNTDIKQNGQEILFSVHPKDKNEALKKIAESLGVFLNLPSLPIQNIGLSEQTSENRIKYQRMEAVVTHLRSQLQLAQAIQMAQHATVEAKSQTIQTITHHNERLYDLASGLIKVIENGKEINGKEYLNGIFKVKHFEGKYFDIDVPKLINKAQNVINRLMRDS